MKDSIDNRRFRNRRTNRTGETPLYKTMTAKETKIWFLYNHSGRAARRFERRRIKIWASVWLKLRDPRGEPMYKRPAPYRTFIYTDDLVKMKPIRPRTAQLYLQITRDALGKRRGDHVTVEEYCSQNNLPEDRIRKALDKIDADKLAEWKEKQQAAELNAANGKQKKQRISKKKKVEKKRKDKKSSQVLEEMPEENDADKKMEPKANKRNLKDTGRTKEDTDFMDTFFI